MKHIMVDLETLGTVADACICSIGAVRFDLDSDRIDDAGFSARISIDSNIQLRRRIQEDTLMWWMKQSDAARTVFCGENEPLETALVGFSDWLGDDNSFMWSNGADFDLPMLAHAFTQCQMEVPWKYWNSRCYRTYKNLPCAGSLAKPSAGVAHDALTDALNQTQHLQAIQAVLTGRVTPPKHRMVAA